MPMSSENLPPAGRFGSAIICLNCTLGAATLGPDELELLQAATVPSSKQATTGKHRRMSDPLSCGNARRMGRHHRHVVHTPYWCAGRAHGESDRLRCIRGGAQG